MNLHTEEIQKLKEERTETEAKIEKLRHQNERLKNREQYLTKRDRAARTHRLCVTGGIVESILPDIKTLTEAEQYELMEHILYLPDAQIKRSAGQSAVAAAAYRAGENLHSDYYGEDSDYTKKKGVITADILLPPHAPPEYKDRETLWNAVEKVEEHPKAQLAYSFDIAL